MLTVIFNNQCYGAVKSTIKNLFPEGGSMKTNNFIATNMDSPPNFADIIKANRGYGITIENPDEIKPAILEALRFVKKEKKQALIDVICIKGDNPLEKS